MGMFDSFYVNGEEYQTKELDCVLDSYSLGSRVPDNGNASSYYLVIGHGTKVGIIIIDNIFVAHCSPDEAETTFNFYRIKSNELTRQLSHIISNELTPKIDFYGSVSYSVSRLLWEYDMYNEDQKDVKEPHPMRFMYKHYNDFADGKSIYDILKTFKFQYDKNNTQEEE